MDSTSSLVALTRDVSEAFARCELTHLERQPIDLDLARAQHHAYEECLKAAGCRVERLAAGVEMPDAVFIEDTAVVFDELAIVTRPGADSRRGETHAVAEALRDYRDLCHIRAPATIDGGDVLVAGRQVFIGRSGRTNETAIGQMREALAPHGYAVVAVDVRGCLHLKSAVTVVGDDLLLLNPAWLPLDLFAAFDRIEVHPDEPLAANAVRIGQRLLFPSSFPRTLERLANRRLQIATVDASEVAKAEGAVTCCSLIFESRPLRA